MSESRGRMDALDEAIYRHPRHQPRQLRMSGWTADQFRAEGFADATRVVGFPLVIDETLPAGEIR